MKLFLTQYRSFAGALARSTNERFIEVGWTFALLTQMFDTDLVTLPPTEFVPDWLIPPQQFFVDSERSDSASASE